MTRRLLGRVALGLVALLLVAQLVPYGRDHANPTPTRPVRFADATTARIVARACGDCHSDLTRWPAYASIAPMSWLVLNDVKGGRENLNFSAWDRPQPDVAEVVDAIMGKGMPPLQYRLIHSGARLSDGERRTLAAGLRRTWATDPPPPGGGG